MHNKYYKGIYITNIYTFKTYGRESKIPTIFKEYTRGYEAKIVKLLNLCFGKWGNLERWRNKYPRYPTFTKGDIVIFEHDGKVVGHGGIHVRDLIVKNGGKVLGALLGDAAVHPDYRGKGIYSKLLKLRLESAKARGGFFAFGWVRRDSISHKAFKKQGFIEVKQPPLYIKMLNPEKIFITKLTAMLHENHKLMNALEQFGVDISFCLKNEEVHLKELLNYPVENEGTIQIILSERALPGIIHFRRISRLQSKFKRVATLLFLMLSGKVKVKSMSMSTFLKLIINGIYIVKAL